ncbi:MAG: ABC transporter ATP-binding protein/permease [Lachnospiraceae bacterium]|nr:ABC transporter ATP-binding protein/permease [Lachnospiraceae bacterium]
MLTLKNITKDYPIGDSVVHALKGIDLSFRESEFVAILGPSGCGKTTLLNIIGGLDHYTSGDLVINGRSTKLYKDKDWDAYRNHSIGFVFQSYNLISHQTVLKNVELALTISGVSKSERRERARKALEDVGLGDQLEKKPNQLSGGQMQRVAIARALVNNPDIVLADEPTGALDTETSVQIMDLLKGIAKDKLVIMVTHNPDLAAAYATRTICLLDGKITSDSKSLTEEELSAKTDRKPNHTSMSFLTALSLSLTNLMTKKARTILTAFAGSIGIIGIALILSLSNGVNNYITRIQEDTLSSYPLTIQKLTADSSSVVSAVLGITSEGVDRHEDGRIYSNSMLTEIVNTMMAEVKTNDLKKFKSYLDSNKEMKDLVTDIRYSYGIVPQIYQYDLAKNGVYQLNPSNILSTFWASVGISESSISEMSSVMNIGGANNMSVWAEIINNQTLLDEQYDLLAGRWPSAYNEVILVVDRNNEISDYTLYSLALKDPNEMTAAFHALMRQETITSEQVSFSYQDLLSLQFRLVIPADYYSYDAATQAWVDRSTDADYMASLLTDNSRSVTLNVVGIIRPGEDAMATSVNGAVGYTHELVEYVVSETAKREIVQQQLRDKELDVFTGHPFEVPKAYSADELRAMILAQLSRMNEEEVARITGLLISFFQSDTSGAYDGIMQKIQNGETVTPEEMLNLLPDEVLMTSLKTYANSGQSVSTYELNMAKLGSYDIAEPTSISIFPKDFKSKDRIVNIISEYNNAEGRTDDERIDYTDYVALLMSSITRIINSITYILIAFVAISLVVSSIMIGIITYISVLERTKEIGILRAIGASKRDIARVFNAETLIIGFVAGTLGIVLTLLLNIPINIIIDKIADVRNLSKLPWAGGVILIIISMILTLIAGIIPSRIAARKDPVTALRTE